jgi:hypothetical protein
LLHLEELVKIILVDIIRGDDIKKVDAYDFLVQ